MKYREQNPYFPTGKPVVGFITPVFLIGGVERWLITLKEALPEYEIIVGLFGDSPAYGGFEVYQNIEKVVKCSDILMVWTDTLPSSVIEAAKAGKPLVHVVHGETSWSKHCAFANSSITKQYVRVGPKRFDTPKPAVQIMNGVNFTRLNKLSGLQKDKDLTFGFVGRYSPEKNPLEVVKEAKKHDAKVLYCSPNPDHSAITSIWPHVTFMRPDQVEETFRRSHLSILKSREEGFGLVFVESWHCGTPIVSNTVGVLRHWRLRRHYKSAEEYFNSWWRRPVPDLSQFSARNMALAYKKVFDDCLINA